ncbi:MAG: hypothetical protein FWD69_14795 [Polyangiaceae bacterium]|nr:hypothetical protein [Polyangiaceae bacterium]
MPRDGESDESDALNDDAFDEARASWGFPAFAKNFPRHPELDALVVAFAHGNYALVRARAQKLRADADDEAIKKAAEVLEARIKPDPSAKILFLLVAALLVFLTVWWVGHDGAP